MKIVNVQVIESLIIIATYIVVYLIFKIDIKNYLKKSRLERRRRKMAIRAVQLFTTITAIILLTGVWGFKQNQILFFVTSILTALGIAFFAQWSLLSNITSSILIFFNHPVKLGDYIKVLHKDFNYEGEVTEMDYFFVHIKTNENETVTIPNSHFFDKSFSVREKKLNPNEEVK